MRFKSSGLDWLRNEIASWFDYPERVRWVQLILTNQNKPLGYIAEAQLALNIINGFSDVPWNQGLSEAHEADLAEYGKNWGQRHDPMVIYEPGRGTGSKNTTLSRF